MKKIIYIIISTILISCSTSENIELKSNKDISETFNESEIKDLQIIFDFFNGQICDSRKLNKELLNKCYNQYCSEIREKRNSENELYLRVNFEQQLEMYEKIDKSTFKEIWCFQQSVLRKEPKDTLKHISFSLETKYFEFLEKYGKENKAINYYSDSFKSVGDISPSMNASLIMQFELYDISDIRTKLIIAIHYLTLNDQILRKEKY